MSDPSHSLVFPAERKRLQCEAEGVGEGHDILTLFPPLLHAEIAAKLTPRKNHCSGKQRRRKKKSLKLKWARPTSGALRSRPGIRSTLSCPRETFRGRICASFCCRRSSNPRLSVFRPEDQTRRSGGPCFKQKQDWLKPVLKTVQRGYLNYYCYETIMFGRVT